MSVKRDLSLLVLHILSAGPQHGYGLAQEIKRRSAGVLAFKEGTLYPALHDLERRQLLRSFESREQGRLRRYYQLLDAGRAALVDERAAWTRHVLAVQTVLGDAP